MNATSHRARLVTVVVGLIALVGPLAAHASRAADPSLTLNVNVSGALEVVLGNGTRIRTSSAPGTVIPPGSYLLIVKSDVPDEKDIFHLFHLSGAGVDMSSDLLPCENPREIYTINLRPNSTYVYEDGRHPDLPRVVFSTSGSGSSSDTAGSATTSRRAGTRARCRTPQFLGSRAVRGSLRGSVTAAGLSLTSKGKAVSLIKSGRYRISVDDRTSKLGFTIAKVDRKSVALTRAPYVGKHTVTVNLTPGRWTFWSAPGAKRSFTVVA